MEAAVKIDFAEKAIGNALVRHDVWRAKDCSFQKHFIAGESEDSIQRTRNTVKVIYEALTYEISSLSR